MVADVITLRRRARVEKLPRLPRLNVAEPGPNVRRVARVFDWWERVPELRP